MPIVRNVSRAVSQLLQSSACGCGVSIVPVRCIGISPRQVASDASFHSVSFSESDHPRVLITGQHSCPNCMPAPGIPHSSPLSPVSWITEAKMFRPKNKQNFPEFLWSFLYGNGIWIPCESPMCGGGWARRSLYVPSNTCNSVNLFPVFIPEIH